MNRQTKIDRTTLIGEGRIAEVFAWKDGQVLKLFRERCPPEWAEYEARIARVVHATGLAVPAVGDVIELEGRWGIVYQRVDGPTMMDEFTARPWTLVRMARQLAELHAEMHTRPAPKLPPLRQRLERKIQAADPLPPDLKEVALADLDRLPDDDALCHGDFHPDNVLMTAQGPVIIDWPDATRGHPLADVARTSLLIQVGGLPPGTARRWLIQSFRALFLAIYLRRYFQLRVGQASRRDLAAWQLPVAAGRLSEDILEEREQVLALVRASCRVKPAP